MINQSPRALISIMQRGVSARALHSRLVAGASLKYTRGSGWARPDRSSVTGRSASDIGEALHRRGPPLEFSSAARAAFMVFGMPSTFEPCG
jgi:hypothetical protein